jgi:hypothetical protein
VRQRRVLKYTLSPETADRKEVTQSLTADFRRELEKILTAAQDEGERLQLQFGDPDTKTPLGPMLQHKAVFCECDIPNLPDYDHPDDSSGAGMFQLRLPIPAANRDYNRQLARFVQHSLMTRKVGFVVYNGNRIPLNDLTMRLVIRKAHGLVLLDGEPDRPSQNEMDMTMRGIRPVVSYFARPGKLTVNELPDRYEVQVEFGKVQAEANGWSDPIYIGTSESCNLSVSAELYADELAAPKTVSLSLAFEVESKPITDLSDEEWARLVTDPE